MEKMYDVIIVGGGPAGLTAAIYLARAQYRVLVIEKEKFGGQITITWEVVNYPGIEQTDGVQLTQTMQKQAQNFGAEFLLAEVTALDFSREIKNVETSKGNYQCFGVLLATGAHPRMAGFQGELEFRGHGVCYCATCDGGFFKDKEVFVIGGGFAAAEESLFLTKYARHVTILIRGEDFSCAKANADQARQNEKITVLTNTVVDSVAGDTLLREIRYTNRKTGETTTYRAEKGELIGVFVFVGYEPETTLVEGVAERDSAGYVITDSNKKTTVEGLYAAGDICVKNLRQVVTAVSDGAIAATELERYAADMQKKTGIKPELPEKKENRTTQRDGKQSIFSTEVITQLQSVFDKMEHHLILELTLDESEASVTLQSQMEEMAGLTDKLSVRTDGKEQEKPCVRILRENGEWAGLAFHGVPGGHEFTSFVIGLYNAAGEGQSIKEEIAARIRSLQRNIKIEIMVTLSCGMCPELVISAQKIAAMNELVSAEVFDLGLFPERKEQYQIMSVPCFVINGGKPEFGKRNLEQLLALVEACG